DVVVFEKFRFFLCEHHDAACSVGEPLEHIHPPRSSYSSEPSDDQRGSIAGFAMSRNRLAVGEIHLPSPKRRAEAAARAKAPGRARADRSDRAEGSPLLQQAEAACRTGFSVLR